MGVHGSNGVVDESQCLLPSTSSTKSSGAGASGSWAREGVSLLKWSCLAACTIGPGTVVVCAKAGADFKLHLVWTVIIASFVAFVLQKEAARLTMESGMSFGAAIRRHFGRSTGLAGAVGAGGEGKLAKDPEAGGNGGGHGMVAAEKVPLAGYGAVLGVFIGNTAYEANCFVGGMAALYVLYTNVLWFRVLMAALTAVATVAAVFWGDVDQIGAALGGIVVAMTVVFAVTAGYAPFDGHQFGWGLLPNFPSGSSITVLSLMATTCIPFNVFLAASLCGDTTPGEMRRGIAFASTITAVISVLLIIIGSDIDIPVDQDFAVEDLGNQIGAKLGIEAKVLFCVGLYSAAYSSAITCPLGAALTAEQILYDDRALPDPAAAPSGSTGNRGSSAGDRAGGGGAVSTGGATDRGVDLAGGSSLPESSESDWTAGGAGSGSTSAASPAATAGGAGEGMPTGLINKGWLNRWRNGGLFFKGSVCIAVGFSFVIAAANVDTVSVILMAQVINGLLLPFLATFLFLCLNDPRIMPRPMRPWDNVLVLVCVSVTIFLAVHLVLDQLSIIAGGGVDSEDVNENGESAWSTDLNIYLALSIAAVGTVALPVRQLRNSRALAG